MMDEGYRGYQLQPPAAPHVASRLLFALLSSARTWNWQQPLQDVAGLQKSKGGFGTVVNGG